MPSWNSEKLEVKLVIELDSARLDQPLMVRDLGCELRRLLSDGHRITVVHGVHGAGNGDFAAIEPMNGANNGSHSGGAESRGSRLLLHATNLNKRLVGALGKCGIAAIGLCGLDANLVRLRKAPGANGRGHCSLEVCAVDSSWLDIISKSGGIPVLVNLASDADQRWHLVNADQMAASCATHWNADTLIFLSECEGFVNSAGSVSRWLNVNDLQKLTSRYKLNGSMLSKLKASHYALKHHVHRTRILPLSDLKSLSLFYSSRIDSGTELILETEEYTHLRPYLPHY